MHACFWMAISSVVSLSVRYDNVHIHDLKQYFIHAVIQSSHHPSILSSIHPYIYSTHLVVHPFIHPRNIHTSIRSSNHPFVHLSIISISSPLSTHVDSLIELCLGLYLYTQIHIYMYNICYTVVHSVYSHECTYMYMYSIHEANLRVAQTLLLVFRIKIQLRKRELRSNSYRKELRRPICIDGSTYSSVVDYLCITLFSQMHVGKWVGKWVGVRVGWAIVTFLTG